MVVGQFASYNSEAGTAYAVRLSSSGTMMVASVSANSYTYCNSAGRRSGTGRLVYRLGESSPKTTWCAQSRMAASAQGWIMIPAYFIHMTEYRRQW